MSEEGTPQSTGPPVKTIKSERLPSLKPKRDLTLGGIKKRVFTPTVPARRQKKTEPDTKPDDGGRSTPKTSKAKGDRRDGKRDKQQQRRKREVITASSVFSMGPGERMIQTRKEMVQFGQRSSSTTHHTPTSIKTEGSSMISDKNDSIELMEVDPLVSNQENVFMDSIIPPIKLPLNVVNSSSSQSLPKGKKELTVKQEPNDDTPLLPATKPPLASEGDSSVHQRLQVSDVFSPSEDSRGMFLLLQLPDCLPTPSTDDGSTSDNNNNDQRGTIRDVPEGLMGTIRVHKSGNVKLVLGNLVFDVTMGTRGGFLQELSSIRVPPEDEHGGPLSLTVLGQLSHRLVCVPDLSCMIQDDR